MSTAPRGYSRRLPWRSVAVTATGFMALWALAGAVGLAGGGLDLGAEVEQRLPFGSPALAGLALLVVVGLPMTWTAVLTWRWSPSATTAVRAAGALLVAWIVVETAVIREVHWLQPVCLAYGLALVALGRRSARAR
ncbi:hypothetical protein L6E12_07120 [Actinokineospora sp. PR83]|uniref:hypothetical protein n=1 Tax=Actinokineospora sp. PR83 TaxID=2884908 RepID=UPI001F2F6FC2|nr:hypothetical protein [Actinokineospora sp. PR83]MCG8915553.1 hypothetical protein [Actinokineospora sp. PR83]